MYFRNLNKIEFVVTNACTGKCKHCSQGNHTLPIEKIDSCLAADAVRRIASEYNIKTVMTFGGEPLLHREAVYAIMTVANELNVEKRQLITNGYFSADEVEIIETAKRLAECGVNDLLLSVDAFHQETIPLERVRVFAREAKKCGLPIRLQPAWLISKDHDNPYNRKTREILDSFADIGLYENDGNVIFPEGNAVKYLKEYFTENLPKNPYVEDPKNVRCISFASNGDVLNGNFYEADIMKIIKDYTP